jgi:hypothetical protein
MYRIEIRFSGNNPKIVNVTVDDESVANQIYNSYKGTNSISYIWKSWNSK